MQCQELIKPQFTSKGDLILPRTQIQPIADSLIKHEKCELAKQKLLDIIKDAEMDLNSTLDSLAIIRNERNILTEKQAKLSYESGYLNAELKEAKKWWREWAFWAGCIGSFYLGSKIK